MKSQLYLKNKEKKFEVKTVIKILKNLKNERKKKKWKSRVEELYEI